MEDISPHFIPYTTLIYKYINNPNSNLPSAKGVNIRFEDAQSKLKEPFLPNVIISIISTYRRTKILEKILATSKGRKDSPLATDMRQHLRIVSNAIKPNVICAKKCPC